MDTVTTKINPFTDPGRKNNRNWLLKGDGKKRYSVKFTSADRWNVWKGRTNGGFILSTAKVEFLGPFHSQKEAERTILDVMSRHNTIPGTAEIIEEETQ